MSLGQRLDRLERAVGLNAPCPVCHGTGCTLADSCIVTAEGDEDPPPPSCLHCGRSPKPGFTINRIILPTKEARDKFYAALHQGRQGRDGNG